MRSHDRTGGPTIRGGDAPYESVTTWASESRSDHQRNATVRKSRRKPRLPSLVRPTEPAVKCSREGEALGQPTPSAKVK